jgi:serine/threonine-protein kinase
MALWRGGLQPTQQPPTRLDLDLGPEVSILSTTGPAVIISPDGTRLAFVSQGQDEIPRLFVRRLDQPKAAQLVGTEGAYAPFFSPDGQWVGFFAGGKLKKTRWDGGEPVYLCDAPSSRGASWGEDSNIVAALDIEVGLSQVPSEGGRPLLLTQLRPGENTHRWPQVLPGGKAVLFEMSTTWGTLDGGHIAVHSLQDHRQRIVLERAGFYPRYVASGHLVYITNGTLFAVPFDAERLQVHGAAVPIGEVSTNPTLGSAQLDLSPGVLMIYRSGRTEGLRTVRWLERDGKTVGLETEPAIYNFPHLSPDGSRLLLTVTQGPSSDLWIYDWQRGSKARLTSGDVTTYPAWSPDGRFVVFQGVGGIFWTRADGAGKPQPLILGKTLHFPTCFSPDGTRLMYSVATPGAGAEIRTVPVEHGSAQMRAGQSQVFLKTGTANTFAVFSPNGRWVAYADTEAGRYEVYVRAFPDNGTKVQISNAGGVMPSWSRSGREIFYRTEDQRIMVVSYSVEGETFMAAKPKMWFGKKLANLGLAPNLDLAPDGKRFVALMSVEAPEPRETQSHVMLVVNFFDEVRRRVAGQRK